MKALSTVLKDPPQLVIARRSEFMGIRGGTFGTITGWTTPGSPRPWASRDCRSHSPTGTWAGWTSHSERWVRRHARPTFLPGDGPGGGAWVGGVRGRRVRRARPPDPWRRPGAGRPDAHGLARAG